MHSPCTQNQYVYLYRETSSYVQQNELEDMEKKATDGSDNTMSIGMLRACIYAITCDTHVYVLL